MDNEPSAEKKARHHARLMRGVVTPILGLLAVASIGLGLMNATEWKPSRTITAQTQVSGSRYVVTDPGVSGLVDDDVSDVVQDLQLAVYRRADIQQMRIRCDPQRNRQGSISRIPTCGVR